MGVLDAERAVQRGGDSSERHLLPRGDDRVQDGYQWESFAYEKCYQGRSRDCITRDPQSGDAPHTHELRLHTLAEGASALTTQPIAHDLDPARLRFRFGDLVHLLPDGAGGLLFSVPGAVYRVPPELTLSAPVVLQVQPNQVPDRAEFVLGEDAAYALLQSGAAAKLLTFNARAAQVLSESPLSGGVNVELRAALAGGVLVSGQSNGPQAASHTALIGGALAGGWQSGPVLTYFGTNSMARTAWNQPRGRQSRNAFTAPLLITFVEPDSLVLTPPGYTTDTYASRSQGHCEARNPRDADS